MVAASVTTEVPIRTCTPEMDGGPGPDGRIGLVALATDQVSERDIARILPGDRLALYVSRVTHSEESNIETIGRLETDIARAASLLLPGATIDVMVFSCTSGSMIIGEERIAQLLNEARPDVPTTNTVTSVMAAFKALEVRRVAMLTPYIEEVNRVMAEGFEARGLEIVDFAAFGRELEVEIAQVTPACVLSTALELDRSRADAIFISCTGLRSVEVIQALEDRVDIPVVTSNQAMAWHIMRLAGYTKPVEGFGRLLAN